MKAMQVKLSLWNLRDLAILIAVLGLGFAGLGVLGTVLLAVILSPVWLAPRGHKQSRLFWVAAFYPVIAVSWLYVVWFNGWFALGHPPRPSLDDPKDINQIEFSYVVMAMLLQASPFVLLVSLISLTFQVTSTKPEESNWFPRPYLLLLVPSLWGLSYAFLKWDPFWVLDWYFD